MMEKYRGEEKTKQHLPLEEKYDSLKNGLNENLQKKHALQLGINQQFKN
jgi:hypothetical protein